MMSSDDEPTYAPDPKGAWRFTLASKIIGVMAVVVVLLWTVPVQSIIKMVSSTTSSSPKTQQQTEPGVQPTTTYQVTPLFDTQYTKVLINKIDQADNRIFVAMFMIQAPSLYKDDWPRWREDPVRRILDRLIAAKRRGVDVEVWLSKPVDRNPSKNKYNRTARSYLKDHRITVKYNPTSVSLHDKVVIIDKQWVFQGSHNWAPGPMSTNHEVSMLLKARSGEQWTWARYRQRLRGR